MSYLKAPQFTSKAKEFLNMNDVVKNMSLNHMAVDIDRAIKISAGTPVKTGDMKAETHIVQIAPGKFRVVSPKEYSATQEAGQRKGAKAFRNYTTAGTGKGWFKRAADGVTEHGTNYVTEAARAVGLL